MTSSQFVARPFYGFPSIGAAARAAGVHRKTLKTLAKDLNERNFRERFFAYVLSQRQLQLRLAIDRFKADAVSLLRDLSLSGDGSRVDDVRNSLAELNPDVLMAQVKP